MDSSPTTHPEDQTLASHRSGCLEKQASEAVSRHLEQCPACRRRFDALSTLPDAGGPVAIGERAASQDGLDATQTYHGADGPGPNPADRLPPGLADQTDYVIKGKLGAGGMGVVYLAHNTLLGRDEVLKVIGGHLMGRSGSLERFLREIRAVAKLRHPNIVTAYSAARRGESIVFAMELVEGLDLARLVKSKGPLPIAHACHFAYQVALGLQHAHEHGLVHRDIKPGNLMLSRDGNRATIKILDFGLAKLSREDAGLTGTGRALGTPHYMAPEQVLDAQSADIRADIYSLGATLYFLLSGRPPFRAGSVVEIYQAHVSWTPDRLNVLRPELPIELVNVVEKMIAKEPAKRFQTPGEVAQALAPFFKKGAGATVRATPGMTDVREKGEPFTASTATTPANAEDSTRRVSGWENLIVVDDMDSASAAIDSEPATGSAWLWPAMVVGFLLVGLFAAWSSGLFGSQRGDDTNPKTNVTEEREETPAEFSRTASLGPKQVLESPNDGAGVTESQSAVDPAPAAKPTEMAGSETTVLANQLAVRVPDPSSPKKPVPSPTGSDASGFQALFNGIDLAGWVPRECRATDWLVQDGTLSFRARDDRSLTPTPRLPSHEKRKPSSLVLNHRPMVLFTERSYFDFVFRLEFRMSGVASTGIVLADLDRGDHAPRFAEFALSSADSPGRKTGDLLTWNFDNLKRRGPTRSLDLKTGDAWNRLELESREGSLRLSVNGQPVEYGGPVTLDGPRRIGLQLMSGNVHFRNLEIRELPASSRQQPLFLGRLVYADDLSDPASGWGHEDIDNGPGQIPFTRNYENGLYFLQAPPNWNGSSAWNAWEPLSQDFQFEVVGRVRGDDPSIAGAWMLVLDGPQSRGLQVTIDRLGRLSIAPSMWGAEKYPNDPRRGPLQHNAIHPGNEWNELTLRVRRRRLEVFVNAVRMCEVNLDWDLTPARPQIAMIKPDLPGSIRAEFDWMEIRELLKDAPVK